MALQFDTTTRNDWLTTLNTQLGASAILLVYSGSPPANCAAGATGTLLSNGVRGNAAGWGAVASGVLTAAAIASDPNATGTGIAGYFRWTDASSNVRMQGTVSAPAGGGDLVLSTTNITAGDTVAITSWTITAPGA